MSRTTDVKTNKRNKGARLWIGGFLVSFIVAFLVVVALMLYSMLNNTDIVVTQYISSPICGDWMLTSGPSLGGYKSRLKAVTSVSQDNVWAVGYKRNVTPPIPIGDDDNLTIPLGDTDEPYVIHWNGRHWDSIPISVDVGSRDASLESISAVAEDKVWVAGFLHDKGQQARTFAAYWDGIQWRVLPTPNPSSTDNRLVSIDPISQNDIWAVGYYRLSLGVSQPLVLHWNGTIWSQQPIVLNNASVNAVLLHVKTLSSRNVWAVGYYRTQSDTNQPFAIHWDGANWQEISMPANSRNAYPLSIAGYSDNDLWAVGTNGLTLHWDGVAWRSTSNPIDQTLVHLNDVISVSTNDVWAVGGNPSTNDSPLILHWDGVAWSVLPTQASTPGRLFYGVTTDNSNELWAVGGATGTENGPWYSIVARFTRVECETAARIFGD